MPRRSRDNDENQAPRRQSARIAAAVASKPATPSPAKKTPKRAAKRASTNDSVEEDVELNGVNDDLQEPVEVEKRPQKKTKLIEDELTPQSCTKDSTEHGESSTKKESASSEPTAAELENGSKEKALESKDVTPSQASNNTLDENVTTKDCEKNTDNHGKDCSGFEIVNRTDVPTAESDDVKGVVAAQGEDGQLLVNYYQVSKDEIPSVLPEEPDSKSDQNANGVKISEHENNDVNPPEAEQAIPLEKESPTDTSHEATEKTMSPQ